MRRWPVIPLGRWSVTEFFLRMWASIGQSSEYWCWASTRRRRPAVGCGVRSQNPVGSAGWVAAKYTPAYTAGDMMRGLTRTHENGAYHVAKGWCEVDAHWCHEPEPQADLTT